MSNLEVTAVKFFHINKGSRKAMASVTFNDVMTIDDFTIWDNGSNQWVNPPQKPDSKKEGEWKPRIWFPKDWFKNNPIYDEILRQFNGESSSSGGDSSKSPTAPPSGW